MGRETKILLALLGLLAGVFMGVVSTKLFVSRPPEGAGPDVHGDLADLETQPLVEPPELDTLLPAAPLEPAADPYAARTSRFSQPAAVAEPASFSEPEPLVQPASFEVAEPLSELPPVAAAADLLPPPADPALTATAPAAAATPPPLIPRTADEPPAAAQPPVASPAAFSPPPATPPAPAVITGSGYVARPGDSWWSLAEQAYGDGRLYRALFAWNRQIDPRVSLQPGTHLEIPQPDRLAAAWPTLVPRD